MGETAFEQKYFQAPDHATEILFVRHGASQAVVPGQEFPMLGDQGDPPLSPAGQAQAQRVCARLVSEPIDAVYVTKLQRTSETAAPLLAATGFESVINPHLHEIFLGEWEGGISRVKLAEQTDPAAIEVRRTGRWDAVPGAERWDDFTARVLAGLELIVSENRGKNVVAFVHGGVIGALAVALAGAELRFGHIENCSITQVVAVDELRILKVLNDTAHLKPLFTRAVAEGPS